MDLTLKAEAPNRNLHKFKGSVTIRGSTAAATAATASAINGSSSKEEEEEQQGSLGQVPNVSGNGTSFSIGEFQTAVTMNEMLLRGCMLKNSGYIVGLVVYTGKETRIQMNAAKHLSKWVLSIGF